MRKILLIGSVILMTAGITIFIIGIAIDAINGTIKPLGHITCMWAGLGIFLVGIATFIVWFFVRTYLKRKEEEKNDIKRGK